MACLKMILKYWTGQEYKTVELAKEIVSSNRSIEDQSWRVEDDLEMYRKSGEDKGLRRIKI